MKSLHSHPKMPDILGQFAYLLVKHTLDALESPHYLVSDVDCNATKLIAINDIYISMFESITSRLFDETSRLPSRPTSVPIPLFYFSAIFMSRYTSYLPENEWLLLRNKNNYGFISGLQALLDGLRRYRSWTRGGRNAQLEESLGGTDQFTATPRFSDGWWEFLDLPSRLVSPSASDPSAPGDVLADSLDNVASGMKGSTWHFPTAPPDAGANIQGSCSVNSLRIGPIRALGGCAVAWGLES
ncbi:hypothetical protein HYPSUDRAFT_214312 [Hypholoma sublateritium FD-334 SS-4]|uniref:Uncharacterized protein n=1 Tax=Hypholoma sublateritium (strain FD-334 SS-4) TaxID=945553 RepID=A0A0D2Q099_HYPSF|nr:hypothetical protein HYPSUDRAFT_214312 [Hypholoma sublateritium FD-334 SS-4]